MAALLAASALALPATALRAQENASNGRKDEPVSAPIVVQAEGAKEEADGPVIGAFATQSATATKTGTPLIETPQSVTVISSQDMEQRQDISVAQALRYSSGVTTENRGGVVTRYDMVTIRGFQVNRFYLDGLQLQYNGWYAIPQTDPAMLERVEVLKGPASVLYGNSPPGGLVNQVSKRPQEYASGQVSATIGNRNLYSGTVDMTGPLDENGEFLYRFIGMGRSEDGQAVTTESERVLFAPSLTWRPTDDTQITFLTHYQRDPKGAAYGAVPAKGSVFDNPNGDIPTDFYDGDVNFEEFDRQQWTVGYIFEHDFDDVFSFKQNARYLQTELSYKSVYSAALLPDDRTIARGAIRSDERSISYAVDNQFKAEFETGAFGHTMLMGLDYWTLTSDMTIGRLTPTMLNPFVVPPIDAYNPDNNQTIPALPTTERYDYNHNQVGVYLQEQMKWGGLVAILGGRQDWYHANNDERLSASTSSLSQTNFSGRAGLLYHFENGFAPYVSYSESFEPQSGADRFGKAFEPTTGEQLEGGIKFEAPNGKLMATAAVFDLTKTNVTTPDPADTNFDIQVGEIRSRGVELEAHYTPRNDLRLSGFYTWLDVEVTKDTSGLQGTTPVWVADQNASMWIEYDLPHGILPGLTLGLGARYVGETKVAATNIGETDPYMLFDAMAEYDLGMLSPSLTGTTLRLNGSNIGDKKYVTGCYSADWCWYGEDRRLSLTLTHRW